MKYAHVITGHTLEEYNAIYKKRCYDLASFKVSEVEKFDKENLSVKYKDINFKLDEKRLLLKGRKWWLIGDTYYEVPRKFSKAWFANLNGNDAKKVGKSIVNYKGFGLICCSAFILILAAIFARSVFSFTSMSTMLNNNAIYSILAVGMCFVLLTGGIDISVGSILAVSAVTTTKFMTLCPDNGALAPLWILLALAIGALCGLINGVLISKLKVVPLIATLGTMYIFRGLAFLITGGQWYTSGQYKGYFLAISQSKVLGITSMTIIAIAIIALAGVFLHLTKPGRRLYAVGTAESSALIAGIKTDRVKILAYVLCGTLAGLAGLLFSSDATQISSEIGNGYEMTAVAICIIGGVANTGGKGRIDCLLLGIIFFSLLAKLLSNIQGFSSMISAFKGGIIIIAVIINIANDAIKARRDVIEMGKRL